MNPWHLWAKTDHDDRTLWHALPWHLLEVGAVAMKLWDNAISSAQRERVCRDLGLTHDEARQFLGFLAALHDFGKASPRFQNMEPKQVERLKQQDPKAFVVDNDKTALRHSLISFDLIAQYFESEFGWTTRLSRRYAQITAAHHGRFWSVGEFNAAHSAYKRTGRRVWQTSHTQLFRDLREAFEIDDNLAARLNASLTSEPVFPGYQLSLWIAGFISVADWLGSDTHFFPFNESRPASFGEALEAAQVNAGKALTMTGWASPPLSINATTFASAIRTIKDLRPNAAQNLAVEMTRSMPTPGLTVVEIPMGWGKTEIALWIAAHYAEVFHVDGTYFAMPTMATSDQLFERVQAHLEAHVESTGHTRIVPLHLLHGMADLSAAEELPQEPGIATIAEHLATGVDPDAETEKPEDRQSVVRRARWFTRKKHGLLARHGVGTVDQALMSVLLTPHMFVRLFGLAGKTVVFDEVHSYDVYMSRLFDRLLAFLGALGSPVVILSATLPQQRTQEMLAAYANGAGWNSPVSHLAAYPRISAIDSVRSQSSTVDISSTPSTMVHLEWHSSSHEDMWSALAARLQAELEDGGTVAVICNTVRDAQTGYMALREVFPEEELTLFHARFRRKERAAIQDRVLRTFGKAAGDDRPRRHIVIATQVIEQSLDLDFDLMVSMFAPTDLLLQRAGRLQRHPQVWGATRPWRFRDRARLWLIGLDDSGDESGPEFPKGSTAVYSEFVLLRSWLALQGRDRIEIPGDVERLIEATYAQPEIELTTEVVKRLSSLEEALLSKVIRDDATAEGALIPALEQERNDDEVDVLPRLAGIRQDPEDAPDAHKSRVALTRLGPPSLSIVIVSTAELRELGFDPRAAPPDSLTTARIRTLLGYAVSVTDHGIVAALRDDPIPAQWADSAHLQRHKIVVVDESGDIQLGDIQLRLDPTIGLLKVQKGQEFTDDE